MSNDRDQAWFWTEEWQAGEREATRAIAASETTVFNSNGAFLAHLDELNQGARSSERHTAGRMARAAVASLTSSAPAGARSRKEQDAGRLHSRRSTSP
jgi:hypothetical protein